MKRFMRIVALSAVAVVTWLIGWADQSGMPSYWQEVRSYQWDQPRQLLLQIEDEIRRATAEQQRVMERWLLEIIQNPQTTEAARKWALRVLSRVATNASIPPIVPFLTNETYSLEACWAIGGLDDPAVDQALRRALPHGTEPCQLVLLETIGLRGRDAEAVPVILGLLKDSSYELTKAAFLALGRLSCVDPLRVWKVAAELECDRQLGIIEALFRIRTNRTSGSSVAGEMTIAGELARQLWQQAKCESASIAAMRWLIDIDPEYVKGELVHWLQRVGPRAQALALQTIAECGDSSLLGIVVLCWGQLGSRARAAFLERVGWSNAIQLAVNSTQDADPTVQIAALRAVGRLGGVADVPMLLQIAADRGGAVKETVHQLLGSLRDREVDQVLIAMLDQGLPAVRIEAMYALKQRRVKESVPKLLQKLQKGSDDERIAAAEALTSLAEDSDFEELLGLLNQPLPDRAVTLVVQALRRLCTETTQPERFADLIIKRIDQLPEGVQEQLIPLLAMVPTRQGLQLLDLKSRSGSEAVKRAAILALANWPDLSSWDVMAGLLKSGPDNLRPLLLEFMVQLLARTVERYPDQTIERLSTLEPLVSPNLRARLLAVALKVPRPDFTELVLRIAKSIDLDETTAAQIAEFVTQAHSREPKGIASLLAKTIDLPSSLQSRLKARPWLFRPWRNIATEGKADSPDGLERDGAAGDDQAAIDVNLDTYWDEQDGATEYRLRIRWEAPVDIVALAIVGYEQESYAPRDFDIIIDGEVSRTVKGARYENNLFFLDLGTAVKVEKELVLRITGYYGGSPAIRELYLFSPVK